MRPWLVALRRRSGWLGVFLVAVVLCVGTGATVSGVRDLRHVQALQRRGVLALATVVENDGHGKYSVLATYPTAGGTRRAVVPTVHAAYRYARGSTVRVVYDPDDPAVVTSASGLGSRWRARTTLVLGVLLLTALAVPACLEGVRWARRQRERSAR